jgi:Reverse transcriptase (RNA-dependent DNA polymerase).
MSPSLFNLYAEKLLEEALRDTPGIQVGEENVKNLKYADDQAVLATSERALQVMIDNINEAGKRFGFWNEDKCGKDASYEDWEKRKKNKSNTKRTET